ncbi:MAG: polyprenyl diphosphate synthase [Candidatus Hodarchaeales archaeon]|jgi:tritrans,polycis-undecaprenyl-diphosphate synthase [geranylgeranyl-diphosphate specific]
MFNPVYRLYESRLHRQIKKGPFPDHIALIMDGNRRFAVTRNLRPKLGHRHGTEKLKEIVRWCYDLDVHVLTIFAFSSENFERPKEEIEELMKLFRTNFKLLSEDKHVHEKGVKIKAIGRLHLLPEDVQFSIKQAEEATKMYEKRLLQVAIGYGGRQELVDAIKGIVKEIDGDGGINETNIDKIDESLVEKYLYTSGVPDPDLIIRTSGEERLSGFLIWQSAYSELYFADVFFPGLRKIDFWRAIRMYQKRERRFGQ